MVNLRLTNLLFPRLLRRYSEQFRISMSEVSENMNETPIKHLLFLYVNAKFINIC